MQKTMASYLLVMTLLLSLLMFLFAPQFQYIPKLLLMLLALGLALRYVLQRQMGDAIVFLLAGVSIVLTLFRNPLVKDLDLAFLVIWVLSVVVWQKRKREQP